VKLTKADLGDRNDRGLSVLAGIVFLNVCLRFWRLPSGSDPWHYVVLAVVAVGVIKVWFLNLEHRRTLASLKQQANEDAPSLLNRLQRQSTLWVYLLTLQVVLLMRPH